MTNPGELNVDQLEEMDKSSLIQIIKKSMKENGDLTKRQDDFMKIANLRLYHLERADYFVGNVRRESFEISGIPRNVDQANLEDEVIEIVREAKVGVNNKVLSKLVSSKIS